MTATTENDLGLAVERFAAGEPVMAAGLDGGGVVVALAAARIDGPRLSRLHELGGDMVALCLDDAGARRLALSAPAGSARRTAGLRLATPIDATDCREGGWSLEDRAHTIRVAADPAAVASDLTVPGHVHAGLLEHGGWSASAVVLELAREAAQPAAVVVTAVRDRSGRAVTAATARRDDRLRALPLAPAGDLCGRAVARGGDGNAVRAALPSRLGAFDVLATKAGDGGDMTVTLVHGDPTARPRPLVRTHVHCLLGDTFGSRLCDCRERLERDVNDIIAAGTGMLVYVKPAGGDPFRCPRAGG